jgi:hypothetical protein
MAELDVQMDTIRASGDELFPCSDGLTAVLCTEPITAISHDRGLDTNAMEGGDKVYRHCRIAIIKFLAAKLCPLHLERAVNGQAQVFSLKPTGKLEMEVDIQPVVHCFQAKRRYLKSVNGLANLDQKLRTLERHYRATGLRRTA